MSILNCHSCNRQLFGAVAYCPYCGVPQGDAVSAQLLSQAVKGRKAPPPLPAVVQTQIGASKPEPPPIVQPAEKRIKNGLVDSPAVNSAMNLPVSFSTVGVPAGSADLKVTQPRSQQSPPLAPSQTPPSKSHAWKYVGTTLVVIGVGIYFAQKPNQQEVACNASLADATAQFTTGNDAVARGLATQVHATCSADVRLRAAELLAALDKTAIVKTGCDKTLRIISSQITDRKMTSARTALDQLDNSCTDAAAATDLRQKVVESQVVSTAIEAEVRSLLTQGDAKAAGAALERLSAQNREHPDLASLKIEILAAMKVIEPPAAVVVMAPSAQAVPAPPPSQPAVPAQVVKIVPAVAGQSELVQAFLHDAEQSLAQQKFDAAKTFVESARRVDPMNAQAAVLWRRIKDRELQYLREETSIK